MDRYAHAHAKNIKSIKSSTFSPGPEKSLIDHGAHISKTCSLTQVNIETGDHFTDQVLFLEWPLWDYPLELSKVSAQNKDLAEAQPGTLDRRTHILEMVHSILPTPSSCQYTIQEPRRARGVSFKSSMFSGMIFLAKPGGIYIKTERTTKIGSVFEVVHLNTYWMALNITRTSPKNIGYLELGHQRSFRFRTQLENTNIIRATSQFTKRK